MKEFEVAQALTTGHERYASEFDERPSRRSRRCAHLNDGGIAIPARVSGGGRGLCCRLAGAGADRSGGRFVGTCLLYPLRSQARQPRQSCHHLAFGRVRRWLLDMAASIGMSS